MPELPEVETVRRTMERALLGKKLVEVEFERDEIVFYDTEPQVLTAYLHNQRISEVGRKGKYWWLGIESGGALLGHLGMAGWIREVGEHTIRLREMGKAPLDDDKGRPRFLKMRLVSDDGRQIVFTDARRLARARWVADPREDAKIKALGPDCFAETPSVEWLSEQLGRRNVAIKTLLLDQTVFAGVGNWIADEVLYHARIHPEKLAKVLRSDEVTALRRALVNVIELAVEVGADAEKYPDDWLFSHRWGGSKGVDQIQGKTILRKAVGGRTTAWVPELQKLD